MILARVVQHRSWHRLPLWAMVTGLNTSVLLGVLFYRAAADQTSIRPLTLALVGWVGVAIYLTFTDVRTRCTQFDMSLPVRSREIWFGHMLALLAGGMVIVAISLGAIGLHRAILSDARVEVDGWMLAIVLTAGLVLAALLLQLPRPSLSRIPVTAGYVLWSVVVLLGTPLLVALAVTAGWAGAGMLFVVAAAVAVWSYRSIPATYSAEPYRPRRPAAPEQVVQSLDPARSSALLLPGTIIRCTSAGVKELVGVPFMLLFGIVLGGGLPSIGESVLNEIRLLYLPMMTYMLFALIGPRLSSLHFLDPLPVSRRTLFSALVLPYLAVLCLGYGMGAVVASRTTANVEYVNFEKRDQGYVVTVPLRVYRFASEGKIPPVHAPWGESGTPDFLRPFSWSRIVVYSPYSAPGGSSARLVALQLSRAVEAVYGMSLTSETVLQRYLIEGQDGSVTPRNDGLTLRADYPQLEPVAGPIFPVLVALVAVPWLLLVAMLLRAYRGGAGERARKAVFWGSLSVLLLLWIVVSLSPLFQAMQPWSIRALVEIPVMRLGEHVASTLVAWIVAIAALAGAFWCARSQFLRMEIPTKPSRYTLLGS